MTTNSQKCLIIGAAGGIGSRLAMRLADRGWSLVLAGRNGDRLSGIASETGGETAELDATDFESVQQVFDDHDGITAAANLAGSILLKPAHMTSADEFQETIDLNLRTSFALVRAAGKAMKQSGGAVVLMSSCVATIGLSNHEAIAAAKAGVEGLTRAAASTYASSSIRFNAVAPGLVNTPLTERITQNDAALKASQAMHALGRIGEPDEVARVIEFLLDPASGWITGQVFGADGGLARVRTR